LEIKENVKKFLKEDEIELWESIYERFKEEGKDGIKNVLEKEANRIQREFENIEREIKKQIEGEV